MAMWTDPGQCSTCKFCSVEPDDMNPACHHPKVREKHHFGLRIGPAIKDFCGEDLTLREPRDD